MTFQSLGLDRPILQGVELAGYKTPTEIQAQTVPLVLEGRDVIASGETGSGKTAAFGLPILHMLREGKPGLRALILVPTRELCVQVAESLRTYARKTDLHVRTVFGGIDIGIQEAAIRRGLDVLVACPGRLLDHLERRTLSLEKIQILVLDEADRMMDMGFMPQIRRILMRCRRDRQNLLFSATVPPDVARLCADLLPAARKIQVGRRSQAAVTIRHQFEEVLANRKMAYLERLLGRERGRVLVFVKTKVSARRLGESLVHAGRSVDSIHGDKSAEARHDALTRFERGTVRCIVATDVAARGLDVDDVELVLNYDMPGSVEDYVHRVGRTGRAGKVGRALSLVSPKDRGVHQAILRHLSATSHHEKHSIEPPSRALAPRTDTRQGRTGTGRGSNGRPRAGQNRDSKDTRDSRSVASPARASATAGKKVPSSRSRSRRRRAS